MLYTNNYGNFITKFIWTNASKNSNFLTLLEMTIHLSTYIQYCSDIPKLTTTQEEKHFKQICWKIKYKRVILKTI